MKLYGFVLSPFVQRVLIAARIKGHEIAVVPPPGGGLSSPAFAAISPTRRIPVLEEADGWRIGESAAIVAYLDETLPGPPLLPAEPRARALARQVAGLGDTDVGAGLRHLMVQNVFRSGSDKGQLDYGRAQLALGLDALQRIGVGRWAWAAGQAPGIADAVLIPQLALAELIERHFDGGKLIGDRPAIADYWRRARVSDIGARCVAEMAALVPIVMARRRSA
ncbi:MAG TPA: glutathione S-transferase family protein [Sphingomonas sp.]